MRRVVSLAALLASATVAHAAYAQSVTAGGSLEGRLGFGSNPYLQLNTGGGNSSSGIAGGSLTAWLQRRSETARTRLTGVASLDQNFRYYGRAENYLVALQHDQTISARLSAVGNLRYQDSINPRNFDLAGTNVDLLAIGQRSRTISADGTIQWMPTSRDSFYFGPQYTHTTFANNSLSGYDQYGLRGGYLRKVNAKLSVGIDMSVQKVNSRGFPDTKSYQGGLRLTYDFSPIWNFDGNVGLIHQVSDFGGSSTTPGFSAKLCGKYPRTRMCVEAARQSASSGFGGLRTDNRISANLSYDLSTRSLVTFAAVYDVSQSSGLSLIPKQKYWEVSGGYSRTITDRLSAGASGRYQYRDYGNFAGITDSTVTGYSVTLDVAYKFGRLE